MLYGKALAAASALFGFAAAAPAEICIGSNGFNTGTPGQIIQFFITTNVVSFPILVDQYVRANTVINIFNGKNCNLRDRPE